MYFWADELSYEINVPYCWSRDLNTSIEFHLAQKRYLKPVS